MKESDLTKKMVTLLKSRGAWARKIHGNMYTAGLPDIIGCHEGVCLALEVKLPGRERTLTDLQRKTLERVEEAGGIGRMVTELEQVDEILDEIEEME